MGKPSDSSLTPKKGTEKVSLGTGRKPNKECKTEADSSFHLSSALQGAALLAHPRTWRARLHRDDLAAQMGRWRPPEK